MKEIKEIIGKTPKTIEPEKMIEKAILPNPIFGNKFNITYRIIITENYQYQQEYIRCNKNYCHCQRGSLGHGPYWYMYYRKEPKKVKYIGKHLKFLPEKIKTVINNPNINVIVEQNIKNLFNL